MEKDDEPPSILFVGTYPPRECGIASFTKDLSSAIQKKYHPSLKSSILAINKNDSSYDYPSEVIFQINEGNLDEYIKTADEINNTDSIKLVSIQHEFGIYGGYWGEYLIEFVKRLNKPVIITFHTVLSNPKTRIKEIVQNLAKHSSAVIVMNKLGVNILKKVYQIKTPIEVIPHGIHAVKFSPGFKEKEKMDFHGRIILSSFGMFSSDKGYEYVLEALGKVVRKFPNLIYLIVGQTHPVVKKREGEKYREFLEKKIVELGLENNVKFENKYLELNEILGYLMASDIYVCTPLNPEQITSGTLAYAVGCGKAVVATPFLHAKEIITSTRGRLVNFRDSNSYADAILEILSDNKLRKKMERYNYANSRYMLWQNISMYYKKLFEKHISLGDVHKKFLPEIKLTHLNYMTDDFGIIQFAKYSEPHLRSGYSIDDCARAMIVCCMHHEIFKDDSVLTQIKVYLNYIDYIQHAEGRMYNFATHNRKINFERWSSDAHARGQWALGYLINTVSVPKELRDNAEKVFDKSIISHKKLFPRTAAFSILGLYYYSCKTPIQENIEKIKELADFLVECYKKNSDDEWKWFEDEMTYSNSKLPEALFCAYLVTGDSEYLEVAKKSFDFLTDVSFEKGIYIPIGQKKWFVKGKKRSYFDQQPVDVASFVQAALLAYDITKEEKYLEDAVLAFHWFLGKNTLNQMVYDELTGGCHDGVKKRTLNLNQGAESTVSYLLARLSLEGLEQFKGSRLFYSET